MISRGFQQIFRVRVTTYRGAGADRRLRGVFSLWCYSESKVSTIAFMSAVPWF